MAAQTLELSLAAESTAAARRVPVPYALPTVVITRRCGGMHYARSALTPRGSPASRARNWKGEAGVLVGLRETGQSVLLGIIGQDSGAGHCKRASSLVLAGAHGRG